MGFSLGGAVALRTAIQHPELVSKLVLMSTVFQAQRVVSGDDRRHGRDGPETAEPLKQSPMYEAYVRIAPRKEDCRSS